MKAKKIILDIIIGSVLFWLIFFSLGCGLHFSGGSQVDTQATSKILGEFAEASREAWCILDVDSYRFFSYNLIESDVIFVLEQQEAIVADHIDWVCSFAPLKFKYIFISLINMLLEFYPLSANFELEEEAREPLLEILKIFVKECEGDNGSGYQDGD